MSSVLFFLSLFTVVAQAIAHGDHFHDHDHQHHAHTSPRSYIAIHGNRSVNVDASVFQDKSKLVTSRSRCGTHDPTEEEAAHIDLHIAKKLQEKGMHHLLETRHEAHDSTELKLDSLRDLKVPVYWHVIMTDDGTEGRLTEEQIKASIKAMNKALHRKKKIFKLMDVTFTQNSEWFFMTSDDTDETQAKAALRQGGPDALNIYSCRPDYNDGGSFSPLLGFATFPWLYVDAPTLDGVVIQYDTVPGGGNPDGYDLGATLTHEVGHWLGLYHVFQGGTCSSNGDSISDTPFQKSATYGCPDSKDSCPNKKGKDSIHNFMDYSDDECLETFSKKQKNRILQAYVSYRLGPLVQ